MEVNIITTIELVKRILVAYPISRNSDNILIANVYKEILKQKDVDVDTLSASDIINFIENGAFPHTESIRRSRQQLQERHTNLRGDNYYKRHKKQDRIKIELGY